MPTTWSSTDKHSSIALSNNNLTATKQSGAFWVAARATRARSTGRWYFEALVAGAADNNLSIGIGSASANINTYPGSDPYGFAYRASLGDVVHNAALTPYGAAYAAGDIIGIAVDFDEKKLWFAKNGLWQNSGSPTSGDSPAFATLTTGTAYYPLMGAYQTGNAITGRFIAAHFTYAPPSGFSDWDDSIAIAASCVHYKTRCVTDSSRRSIILLQL